MFVKVAIQVMMRAYQDITKNDTPADLQQVLAPCSSPEPHTRNSIQQKPDTEIGDKAIDGGKIISTETTHASSL